MGDLRGSGGRGAFICLKTRAPPIVHGVPFYDGNGVIVAGSDSVNWGALSESQPQCRRTEEAVLYLTDVVFEFKDITLEKVT